MTRDELLKICKPMMVNLEVAKTMNRKTQTRRLIKPQPLLAIKAENERHNSYSWKGGMYALDMYPNNSLIIENASKWQIGDILWVREPAKVICNYLENGMHQAIDFTYLSDGKIETIYVPRQHKNKKWVQNHQGIPNGCLKEMARTFLRVINVKVERLKDIKRSDIRAEGCNNEIMDGKTLPKMTPLKWWINLWDKTAPKGYKWEDNPYVFVYEFEKIEAKKSRLIKTT